LLLLLDEQLSLNATCRQSSQVALDSFMTVVKPLRRLPAVNPDAESCEPSDLQLRQNRSGPGRIRRCLHLHSFAIPALTIVSAGAKFPGLGIGRRPAAEG
jgi:hypothetical protein